MTIQHSAITDPDIHESKGVAAAVVGKVFMTDGLSSGSFTYPNSHGSITFQGFATPTTITSGGATVWTKSTVTTVASGIGLEITEATTCKLTYTGILTKIMRIFGTISMSQASGGNRNLQVAVYKNGTILANSAASATTVTAAIANISFFTDVSVATNDYFEIYLYNSGTGDFSVNSLVVSIMSMGRV